MGLRPAHPERATGGRDARPENATRGRGARPGTRSARHGALPDASAASLEDPAAAPKHDWLSVIEGGVALTLHVQPGAKKTGIAGVHAAALKIRLAALPIEGRANEALLRFVAERLGVPRRNVALVRGESSRDKVLRVSGVDSRSARRLLAPQDRWPGRRAPREP